MEGDIASPESKIKYSPRFWIIIKKSWHYRVFHFKDEKEKEEG